MEKRRMCPNCRAFITISDRVCPYCEAPVGPRAVDLRPNAFASSFLPSANLSAIIILVINVAFFALESALRSRMDDPFVAYGLAVFRGGQWWRLITAGFFHADLWHLAMNSWSLFILVTEVEQFYGTNRMIVTYVVSTFTGFFFACFYPHSVLGASAAAFGLMGVMLAMGFLGNRAEPLTQIVRQHYGQWLIFGLVMSFYGNISWQAHVGGLVGGFLIGAIAGRPGHPAAPREMFWKVMAFACVAVVVLCWYKDFELISFFLKHSQASM